MLDKCDIKYSIRNKTKEKLTFLGVLSILSLSFWISSDKDMLFKIVLPINLTNAMPSVTSFLLLGTAINVFVLPFLILYEIRRFRKTSKRMLIRGHRLNSLQTDRILKKLYIFKELIYAVLKPNRYNINETQ
ncbi:hypothetical protein SFC65_20280 [Priestia filamentosa]|uniref:hypothetical protein n=1 Tax=Priestia filamentosa TaxID=1402861 RepID=UPI003981B1FD